MGINDPIVVAHSLKWGWMLHRGRETFFNDDNEMRTWGTMEEARQWAIDNLGVDSVKEQSTPDGFARYEKAERKKTDFTDLPLFSKPTEVEFPEIDTSKMLRFKQDDTD